MKDKILIIVISFVTFSLSIICYAICDYFVYGDVGNSIGAGIIILFFMILGLLCPLIVIIGLFGAALFIARKWCGKTEIELAKFGTWLASIELVIHFIGFYECGIRFGWLISALWGIYFDLIFIETLLIIAVLLLVELVKLYVLYRRQGRLHPAVNIVLKMFGGMAAVVLGAYYAGVLVVMFCNMLWAQGVTDWIWGKGFGILVLGLLLPAVIVVVSLAADYINKKKAFLKEEQAQIVLLISNFIYLRFFYYSWDSIILESEFGAGMHFPIIWNIMLVVDMIWGIVLLIKIMWLYIRKMLRK